MMTGSGIYVVYVQSGETLDNATFVTFESLSSHSGDVVAAVDAAKQTLIESLARSFVNDTRLTR